MRGWQDRRVRRAGRALWERGGSQPNGPERIGRELIGLERFGLVRCECLENLDLNLGTKAMGDPVDRILGHPIRKRLIEALWHSSEPLSAQQFYAEYTDGSDTLITINYHIRVLERDGVAKLVREDRDAGRVERFVALSGPNCAAVVRRLELN